MAISRLELNNERLVIISRDIDGPDKTKIIKKIHEIVEKQEEFFLKNKKTIITTMDNVIATIIINACINITININHIIDKNLSELKEKFLKVIESDQNVYERFIKV